MWLITSLITGSKLNNRPTLVKTRSSSRRTMKIMVWTDGLAACYCFVVFGLAIHNWILAQTQSLPPFPPTNQMGTSWATCCIYDKNQEGWPHKVLFLQRVQARGNLSWKLIVNQEEMIEKYTFVMSFPPNLSIT
jgi:hypothetical protein